MFRKKLFLSESCMYHNIEHKANFESTEIFASVHKTHRVKENICEL